MAAVTPPLFQTVDNEYTGSSLGLPYRDWVHEGVLGAGDLAVTQRGAGPNMSVDVAAGVVWVAGDDSALQPTYRCYNDATVNLTIAAAHGSLGRIDRVVAEVRDAAFSGVSTDWRLRVITGTPHSSPSAPAQPDTAVTLALVSVPATDTTIEDAQITDTRPRAQLGAVGGVVPEVAALPPAPHDGMVIDYVADPTNGVVWRFRYRTASGSSYKWEFVGGSPLEHVVDTEQGTASGSYVALGAGPTVTAPLSGEYVITFGASSYNSTADSELMSISVGGGAANDNDASTVGHGAANRLATHSRRLARATLGGTTVVQARYRVLGGTAQFRKRWMTLTPVRVG